MRQICKPFTGYDHLLSDVNMYFLLCFVAHVKMFAICPDVKKGYAVTPFFPYSNRNWGVGFIGCFANCLCAMWVGNQKGPCHFTQSSEDYALDKSGRHVRL